MVLYNYSGFMASCGFVYSGLMWYHSSFFFLCSSPSATATISGGTDLPFEETLPGKSIKMHRPTNRYSFFRR